MARKVVSVKVEEADLERWDAAAEARGISRSAFVEAAAEAFLSGGVSGGDVTLAPEVRERIEAQLGGGDLSWWVGRLCEGALHTLDERAKAKPKVPSTAVRGFVGSKMEPNRDVPQLGWYRPGEVEAKKGVELNLDLLKQTGVRRGTQT